MSRWVWRKGPCYGDHEGTKVLGYGGSECHKHIPLQSCKHLDVAQLQSFRQHKPIALGTANMPSYEHFQGSGRTRLGVYGPQPTYQTYISPYGPKTKHLPNLWGLSVPKAMRYGGIAAGFGASAGIFALFFFGEVPKVRTDILQKFPVIGDYFIREVPPEDNPF